MVKRSVLIYQKLIVTIKMYEYDQTGLHMAHDEIKIGDYQMNKTRYLLYSGDVLQDSFLKIQIVFIPL